MSHWVKFSRAHEHLNEVETVIERFLRMKPYRFVSEYQPAPPFNPGDEIVFTLRVDSPAIIPPQLPGIVGDCLTNFRASLDHLIYAIALKHTRRAELADQTSLSFPIADTQGGFDSWKRKICKTKLFPDNLLPDEVVGRLEALQPYQGWDGPPTLLGRYREQQPLWILNALVNMDKHRTFVPVAQLHASNTVSIEGGAFTDAPPQWFSMSSSFKHGAELIVARFRADVPEAKVIVNLDSPPGVAFGDEWPARGRPIGLTFQHISNDIRNIVFPELEPFL